MRLSIKKSIIILLCGLTLTSLILILISENSLKFGANPLLSDYKFWYITRNDNGQITEAGVRFFEGQITTKPEKKSNPLNPNEDIIVDVTKYRRSAKIATKIYTAKDFGIIFTDDELRLFLNGELAKDTTRTPVPEETGTTLK